MSSTLVNALGEEIATNTKLEELRLLLADIDANTDMVEAKLDELIASVNVDLSTRASEATLEAARVLLASVDAKDFATEAKLEEARALIASLESKVATAAKQLPDNHQVTVSNPTADPETGLSKEARQVVKRQRIIFDGALDANAEAPFAWIDTEDPDDLDVLAINVELNVTHASAEDGFQVRYSHDASKVVNSDDFYAINPKSDPNNGSRYTFNVGPRYYGVYYKNGGAQATRVVIVATEYRAATKCSSHKANEAISDQTDLEGVKAVLTGRISTGPNAGSYANVRVRENGRLETQAGADDIGSPVPTEAYTQGMEDPAGDLAVPKINASRQQEVDVKASALPAGAATAAKQLPDNHQVQVSNQLDQPLTNAELRAQAVVTKDNIGDLVEAGLLFTAGGPAQTTNGTQQAAASLVNPAGSGVTLVIASILIQHDDPDMLTALFMNGGTNSGGTRTPMNHLASGAASVAEFRVGVDGLSGATELSPHVFVSNVSPFQYDGAPIIVLPGETKSVRLTGQTLTTINYVFNATWIEVPN